MVKNILLVTTYILSPDVTRSWSSPRCFTPPTVETSRRDVFQRTTTALIASLGGAALLIDNPPPAAASTTPSPKELERLQKGYARVRYLLDHWDELTEKCGTMIMSDLERKQVIRTEGGGGGFGCEKTPLRVQEFLGYKSTEDPLFKADKLMVRAAPLVDPDQFEDYLDAVERYREKADQGSMMAYTSSWGEANPNGGKEVIEEYLDRTKVEVITTEKLLLSILGYLNLSVPPPLTGKQ
eukprot:CAMPEP_0172501058 /NCGR_PEP_ID=MMETSP1066-20121228/145752_1 /TAXON_ID=671091 /ORGANISM="Coscinodiscus wailesii, Strain CCMP2513" /LENGTH=238 /DNA_ID=CAMNT_0013275647 /DNA_START=107 /DNA_END=823 /DNA_ORIENTATION=+